MWPRCPSSHRPESRRLHDASEMISDFMAGLMASRSSIDSDGDCRDMMDTIHISVGPETSKLPHQLSIFVGGTCQLGFGANMLR